MPRLFTATKKINRQKRTVVEIKGIAATIFTGVASVAAKTSDSYAHHLFCLLPLSPMNKIVADISKSNVKRKVASYLLSIIK